MAVGGGFEPFDWEKKGGKIKGGTRLDISRKKSPGKKAKQRARAEKGGERWRDWEERVRQKEGTQPLFVVNGTCITRERRNWSSPAPRKGKKRGKG